jgi:hypothetical protein
MAGGGREPEPASKGALETYPSGSVRARKAIKP